MRNRSPVAGFFPAVVITLAFLVAGGCRTETGKAGGPSAGPSAGGSAAPAGSGASRPPSDPSGTPAEGLAFPEGYPYKGKPIFAVGRRPVSEEELRRFSARMLGIEEHSKHPAFLPDNVIRSFARYWAVAELGVEKGVHESPRVRNVVEVYRHAAIANDYRARLEKTLPVPDAAIRGSVPSDWTRMEFSVVTFPDPADAARFAEEALKKKKSLGKAEFGKYAEGAFRSRTGKIFRGSGFFDLSEEDYLFALKEGDVSRPVDTGIGRGVCYVFGREFLDGKAREEYLEQRRAAVRAQEVDARFKGIVDKARFTIHKDELAQAVQVEGRSGLHAELTVLTLHTDTGDVSLTYRDFRNLVPAHFSVYFRMYPPENWTGFVLPEVQNLAHLYAVGREARREGVPLGARWDTELFDFRWKTVYLATLDTIAKDAQVSVTDGEVERYYKSNRGYFDRKETVRIRYVYSPSRDALLALIKQAGSGQNIFAKKEHRDLVKSRFVAQGDATHEELFKALNGLNAGDVSGVLKADMGYYIAKVEERRGKGFLPLSEVREQVRSNLLNEKRQDKVREAVGARMTSVAIRKI